jgi:hypothetical protein
MKNANIQNNINATKRQRINTVKILINNQRIEFMYLGNEI